MEKFDADQLKDFGSWLEAEGLQAIATRVSTGEECTIIIEDGMAAVTEDEKANVAPAEAATDIELESF
jgi:hypothetical protein